MTSRQLKGALLEYLIRRLLNNCGFTSVRPDGHYVFAQRGNGLFFINGKGAAHDADVLMEPPIQMPFSYPARLLFECKAYDENVGLGVIRNALGLRYDINEFEIITDESIQKRKNNRRASYAIANRKRYNYQVGVASIEEFSKPAFEFAANNKIPLISLRWFLSDRVCKLFHTITKEYMESIPDDLRNNLYTFLKDKSTFSWYETKYSNVINFIERDNTIGEIISYFNTVINKSFVGLIETGDLIFLFANQTDSFELLNERIRFTGLKAQLHYFTNSPDVWKLELIDGFNHERNPEFKFYLPRAIMSQWKEFKMDANAALNLKDRYFSRIFIFRGVRNNSELPFFVVNIDSRWLNRLRSE